MVFDNSHSSLKQRSKFCGENFQNILEVRTYTLDKLIPSDVLATNSTKIDLI